MDSLKALSITPIFNGYNEENQKAMINALLKTPIGQEIFKEHMNDVLMKHYLSFFDLIPRIFIEKSPKLQAVILKKIRGETFCQELNHVILSFGEPFDVVDGVPRKNIVFTQVGQDDTIVRVILGPYWANDYIDFIKEEEFSFEEHVVKAETCDDIMILNVNRIQYLWDESVQELAGLIGA